MTARPARILVVDDAKEVLLALEQALSWIGGYSVSTAVDVDTAFEIAARERPDLVITDVILNGPVGLDLITRIRSDLAGGIPQIIACSGFPDFADEARRRGAYAFLPKPIMLDDLLVAVAGALEKRELSSSVLREVERHSIELRERARIRAVAALARIAGERDDVVRRMRAACAFAGRYFDVRWTLTAIADLDGFRVAATGPEPFLPEGMQIDDALPFPRNVLESGAVFAVSNLDDEAIGAHVAERPRFCAGVPFIAPGGVPVGALCLLDPARRTIDSEDLAILAELGRCATARLEDPHDLEARLFTDDLLLTRRAFEELLAQELHRARKRREWTEVAVVVAERSGRLSMLAEALGRDPPRLRAAIAALGPSTLGIYAIHPDATAAARAVQRTVAVCADVVGVVGAGAASIEGAALDAVRDAAILRGVEAIATHARGGAVERYVFRREPWAPDEARSEPPAIAIA